MRVGIQLTSFTTRFIIQDEASFNFLLKAAEGEPKAKQLAAQIIPKFYKYFPTLGDQALTVLLDLTEDQDDVNVRAVSLGPPALVSISMVMKQVASLTRLLCFRIPSTDSPERHSCHGPDLRSEPCVSWQDIRSVGSAACLWLVSSAVFGRSLFVLQVATSRHARLLAC